MEDLKFQIKRNNLRAADGLRIYPQRVVLEQRSGEKAIPIEEITELSTNRSAYDFPFFELSLRIVAQGKKFVIRRLKKSEAKKAKEIIANLIPPDRINKGYASIG